MLLDMAHHSAALLLDAGALVDRRDQGASDDRAEMLPLGQCRHARKQAQARDFPHEPRRKFVKTAQRRCRKIFLT
ncbi:hypothetical protein WAE31_12970 (plasmid) [Xanthomonas axonopodis pv. vasculorum]